MTSRQVDCRHKATTLLRLNPFNGTSAYFRANPKLPWVLAGIVPVVRLRDFTSDNGVRGAVLCCV